MAFFKLNISDVKEKISDFDRVLGDLTVNMDDAYKSLAKIDSYWQDDPNLFGFILNIRDHNQKFNDLRLNLVSSSDELSEFCINISSVCSSFNYPNVKSIKFDDTRLSSCLNYLNQSIELLNINFQRLNSVKSEIDLVSVSSINQKMEEIKAIIKLIENLKKDISGFCESINKQI